MEKGAKRLCYISWDGYHKLLCCRSPWTFFFFLLNQGSWKNFKELKSCWADTCADVAERPAGPLVALWAWLSTWLCPSAHSVREGLQSSFLYNGGAYWFQVSMSLCDRALGIILDRSVFKLWLCHLLAAWFLTICWMLLGLSYFTYEMGSLSQGL